MLMSMTIGKREVGWVIRHRMALGGNPNTSIGYREIGLRNLGHSNILDRIALGLRTGSIESILQFHIRIHRIILRRSFLLCYTIINRYADLSLVWEELTHFQRGGYAIGTIVVGTSASHTVFQTSKSFADISSRSIDTTEIRQLYIEISIGSPSTLVVMFLEAEFVYPDFTTLDIARIIAHTNHHGLHLAKARITHNGQLIVRVLAIVC